MTSRTYRVRRGDTLTRIARLFATTIARLVASNRLRDPDRIRAGQVLRVPDRAQAAPLGALSRKYEVGNRGAGTVSSGRGDRGGVSYGSYQLASALGRVGEFLAAEGQPWAARLACGAPGSAAFGAAWRQCAADDPERFESAQHAFIARTHYAVQCELVKRRSGVDIARRARALQEAVWSTAVQHGPSSTIVLTALEKAAPPAGDRALIEAIYSERARRAEDGTLVHFRSNSRAVQESVARRLATECREALALLAGER